MTLIQRVVDWQHNHPFIIIGIFLAITVALLPGMGRVETIVALENMMPGDAESVKTAQTLRNEGFGFDVFAVEVTVGNTYEGPSKIDDPTVTAYLTYVSQELAEIRGVINVQNPALRPEFVTPAQDTAIISMQGYQGDDGKEISRIFREIKEVTAYNVPQGVRTEIVGVPAVQQELSDIVNADTVMTGVISLLLVFLITLLIFEGSLNAAVLPIIIVGLSVVWLYGTMGYLGIPLSTLAGSVAALVIGIGVDYSIHILNTYRYHRGHAPKMHSLEEAVGDTGVAILVTSITTISAFLSFLAGSMPEMHRFGIIMSLGIAYALILSFVFLPALFIAEEKMMDYVTDRVSRRF